MTLTEPGGFTPLTTEEAVSSLLKADTRPRFGMGWSVDDKVGNVGTGEMALMWARSGGGKSTWLLNVIANTPQVPTLVVNMEMTARRQTEWLAAMTFRLPVEGKEIEELLAWGEDDPRYAELVGSLEQMPDVYPHLHFAQPTRPSIEDLFFFVDEIDASTGTRPQRIFIDHLGLMQGASDYNSYSALAGDLHSFAMDEEVALYVIQQTGRSGGSERNMGHIPVTLNSGVYAGEADADFVYGMYRPDRNPKFQKSRWDFDNEYEYMQMRADYEEVRGIVVFQVIKNRPFGDLLEEGMTLHYDNHTRRYKE